MGAAVTPKRYRRRPREVTAMQYMGDNGLDICRWAKPDYDPSATYALDEAPIAHVGGTLSVCVFEPEQPGVLDEATAVAGEWILREDATGEYEVMTADEFDAQYEVIS